MTKVSVTHEGGAGPVTVRKKWTKDGSMPAGAESFHMLTGPNEQHTFELEDGLEVAIIAGGAAINPAGGATGQQ